MGAEVHSRYPWVPRARPVAGDHLELLLNSTWRSALSVTGGLIGLRRDDTFASRKLQLRVGDILVLATDGLTEARDTGGIMLGDEQAMRWIARANPMPQRLADEIVSRLQHYGGGRTSDDLALLVIRVQRAPAGTAPLIGAAPRHDVAPTQRGKAGSRQ